MASSQSNSSTNSTPPCAACKLLRRKCIPGCIFAPYFPPDDPQKFANVHKIFGASNITKLLNDLLPYQREDAVNSLAYEAEARMKDPVYGCVGAISVLQKQVQRLQNELDAANTNLLRYACNIVDIPSSMDRLPLMGSTSSTGLGEGSVGGGDLYHHHHASGLPIPYTQAWGNNNRSNYHPPGDMDEMDGGERSM